MGVRDALLHNTTGSNFEALQSGDTARIKGDFSVKNTSDVEIFGVDVSTATVNVSGNITSSMNISGSATGSFGRVVASTYQGDGASLRDSLPRTPGIVTASAQLASYISGAFESGFFFGFQASSSISGGLGITGSFGRVEGIKFYGSGTGLQSTLPRPSGLITSSAQLADRISGSFNKGFEFTGTIAGDKLTVGGVWSVGSAMVGTYYNGAGAGAAQNAALHFGGRGTPGSTNASTTNTEEWNGTNWSEQNNMLESHRRMAGAGSQNSALSMGGYPGQADVLYYNGTNWAEKADLPAAKQEGIGVGKDADALHIGGGNSHPSVNSTDVDKFSLDGNAWSEETSTPVVVGANAAAGTTEALIIPIYGASEGSLTYNGSSWTEVASLIVSRANGMGIFGTQNDAVNVGGCNNAGASRCCTEIWNGSTWSAGNAMNTGRSLDSGRTQGSPSSGNAGLAFSTAYGTTAGGGAASGHTELYNGINTATASFGRVEATTFHGDGSSLKDTLPRAAGTVTASAQLASRISGSFNKGFTFTTTSSLGHPTGSLISAQVGAWSVGGNLNTGRNNHNSCTGAGVSSANAVSLFGGKVPASPNYTGKTENYNGTSWSESGDLDEARADGASFGTQNAGVYAGGEQGGSAPNNGTTFTEEFNGTAWSEVTAYPQAMVYATGAGTQTAGLVAFGGQSPAPTPNGNRGGTYSVEYNGTNWVNASTAANFGPTHSSQIRHSMAGVQNAAITVGNGDSPPGASPYMWCTVMNYDGSSWTIGTSTPNGNKWTSLAGTQNDVLSAGGYSYPQSPNQFHSTTFAQRFNGTAWSSIGSMTNDQVAAGGAGLTSYQMTMYGGYTEGHPSWTGYVDDTQEYCEGISNLTVGKLKANHLTGDGSALSKFIPNIVSSSAQLATRISGSFNKGFEFTGQISGSATSTGSFGRVDSDDFRGDGSELTNIPLTAGVVSSSAQISASISGSFNKGFEFTGEIKGAGGGPGAWSLGIAVPHNTSRTHVATGASPNAIITVSGTGGDTYNGTAWSEITAAPNPTSYAMATGPYDAAMIVGGNRSGSISWNGSSWAQEGSTDRDMTVLAAGAGTTEATLVFGGLSETSDVNSSANATANTEAYDGTSWSEVNDMLIARGQGFQTGIGTQNSTISFGGCGVPGATIDPPSPYSDFTFSDPRSQGDHLEEWNGTNWTYKGEYYAHPQSSYFVHSGAGVGTANASSFFGGYTRALGGSGINYSHYHWDGTAMSDGTSMLIPISYNKGAGQGGAGGAHANVGGYSAGSHAAPSNNLPGYFQLYEPTVLQTGSFGLVENATYHGDGSNIRDTLSRSVGILSGSAQIAAAISGAILGGPGFHHIIDGTVSGSIFTTGSFGDLRVKYLTGDGTSISSSIISSLGVITASSEIAADISGSFTSGFELFSLRSGLSGSEQRKSYYVGVSGSEFANVCQGNAHVTMSISSICGSDFDYRLFDNANQIKGTSYGTGVWSNATAMPVGVNGRGMAGTQNAFLSMGAYSDPNKTVTQKFNGNSWSLSAALNTGGRATAGVGTQNAAGLFGGYDHSYNGTEFYFGAAWSEGPTTITTAAWKGSAGTVNAALLYGGNGPSNAKRANTELYNGDVFTETADLSTARGLASAGGTQNDAIYASGLGASGGVGDTEIWDGTSWTEVANVIQSRWNSTGIGTANHHIVVAGQGPAQVACVEEWNGDSWSEVNGLTTARSYAGPSAGGLGSQGIYAGGDYAPAESPYTELWNATATTTGSFGLLKPRGGGINTKAFQVTSSLFKLPVFSDVELNYQAYEAEYSTGSLSGSVDRVADVTVGQNLGEMWFDSDKNAVGYTYSSSSLISQSLSVGVFADISASGNYVSCSQGLFTQSFYSHTVVTCYLTGSQI